MRFALLSLPLLLAACQSEEECAEEIRADLFSFLETAKEAREFDLARTANDSALRIVMIKSNKNMDACDYFADGPFLREK